MAVFRFTLGIPGFDDALIPRAVGALGAAALVANHVLGAGSPSAAQARGSVPHAGVLLAGKVHGRLLLPPGHRGACRRRPPCNLRPSSRAQRRPRRAAGARGGAGRTAGRGGVRDARAGGASARGRAWARHRRGGRTGRTALRHCARADSGCQAGAGMGLLELFCCTKLRRCTSKFAVASCTYHCLRAPPRWQGPASPKVSNLPPCFPRTARNV